MDKVHTGKQMKETVRALEKLLSAPEVRDIRGEIEIDDFYLVLRRKGLFEYWSTSGDPGFNDPGSSGYRKIGKGDFKEIIEEYKLTPKKIKEIYKKLTS